MAPHGVYGGGNPWMKPKMDVKRENTSLPSDSATANCGWLLSGPTSGNTAAKVTTDGNSQKVKSGQKPNFMTSYQTMGPPPPKMATFDGKSEWNPLIVQFNMIATRYNWTNDQRLERLV